MFDIEQFNILYKSSSEKVCKFAQFYVRDKQIAEDITIDSFMKLWETMQHTSIENPLALLLTIIKNKSLDHLKKQLYNEETVNNMSQWQQQELSIRISNLDACNPDIIFSNEIREIMLKTLKNMPEQTRRVFIMSRFENKTGKEIAEELKISVKGVDYHINKVLKELRIALKDYLPFLLLAHFNI